MDDTSSQDTGNTADHNKQAKISRKERWQNVLSTVLIFVLAPLIAILLTGFVFQTYEVDGMSMEGALQNKDRLIIWKTPRTISRITRHPYVPSRYDIVVINSHQLGIQIIKRVIGLPGDRVVLSNGPVTIYNNDHPDGYRPDDGQKYGHNLPNTPGDTDIVVPKNHVFVLGDNRDNSEDSSELGPIAVDEIVGKLAVRVLPVNNLTAF